MSSTKEKNMIPFNERNINIYGRYDVIDGELILYHSASGIEFSVEGGSVKILLHSTGKSYMRIYVDGSKEGERLAVSEGEKEYVAIDGISAGRHTIRLVKATEESEAIWTVKALVTDGFLAPPKKSDFKMEFIGDSLTAGYGVLGKADEEYSVDNSDSTKSYAYRTAYALNANYSIIGWSGICVKAYMFVSDLNMTQLYEQVSNRNNAAYEGGFDADVVVLNLGTNDTAYFVLQGGSAYGEQFPTDYKELLRAIRAKNPRSYIVCLYGMMVVDEVISGGIQAAIKALNDEKIVYNPFPFEPNNFGVNGHPNNAAHKSYSEGLVNYLKTCILNRL